MLRILHIFMVICIIGSAAYSYRVKYDSIALVSEMNRLKKEIDKTKNAISEAKAEWQVLNNPDRLQKLAALHTHSAVLEVEQIIRWSDLPVRPPPADPIADKLMLLGVVEAEKPLKAGSVTGTSKVLHTNPPHAALPLEKAANE